MISTLLVVTERARKSGQAKVCSLLFGTWVGGVRSGKRLGAFGGPPSPTEKGLLMLMALQNKNELKKRAIVGSLERVIGPTPHNTLGTLP